jgi:hypothetical protein
MNHSISILFTFDTWRNFSRLTIHANNYFPKQIYAFRLAIVEFLSTNDSLSNNMTSIHFQHQRDDQFDMARPIMIDLQHRIALEVRIHLYFDSPWLLISEITFDSFPLPLAATITSTRNIAMASAMFDTRFVIVLSLSLLSMICIFTSIVLLRVHRQVPKDHSNVDKRYFTTIHNQTNSSVSTTCSDIDLTSTQHAYASINPYHYCTNECLPGLPSNSKQHMPLTTSLLRSPSTIQQYHIEGICGNSSFSTQRIIQWNIHEHQFIPNEWIHQQQRLENRHQLLQGGEVNYTLNLIERLCMDCIALSIVSDVSR